MSIFKKDCPECAASNGIDAVHCSCGYCFDPDALAGADADAYAEEQGRLYLDYLGARIVQAEAELTVAREQAKTDPANTYQAAAALLAEQTLNSLRAEMKQLTMRLAVRRSSAGPNKHLPAVSRAPAASVASKPKHIPAIPRSATTADVPKPAARPLASSNQPAAVPSASTTASATPRPVAAPAPVAKVGLNKGAEIHSPGADRTSRPLAKRAAMPMRPQPPKTQPSAKPSANFRKVQARKADAIAKSQTLAPVAKVKRAPSSVVSTPTTAPARVATSKATTTATRECPSCSAAVASDLEKCACGYTFSKAATEMPAISLAILKTAGKESMQECPNCTASVPASRERCNCGYTFPKPEQVPALALDATALAILTDGIKPNSTSRRR